MIVIDLESKIKVVRSRTVSTSATTASANAKTMMTMPAITERGIVSASGYTEAAINKARRYGVTLYSLLEWSVPVEIATTLPAWFL